MSLVVQKYGGSSVATASKIVTVASRIARTQKEGAQVAVVVSAMGDTTNDLIKLAHQVCSEPSPREMDLLLSTGELVTSTLMAMALERLGVPAISLGGAQAGIRTNTAHGRASIIAFEPSRVKQELDEGRLPIIAGFQGANDTNDVTTLGRGGSDTTAVALAAALGATRCEIYTDVDGIFTADPRVVPEAVKLDALSYEEMLELASYGAKMHPRSIEMGAIYNVPILVASSANEVPGTLIHGGVSMELINKVRGVTYEMDVARITVRGVPDRPGIAAIIFGPLSDAHVSVDTIVQNASADRLTDLSFTVEQDDLKRALEVVESTAKEIGAAECVSEEDLGNVSIVGTGMQNSPGYASDMFRALANAGVNIEMITTSQIRITCIISRSQVHEAVKVLHKAFQLDQQV